VTVADDDPLVPEPEVVAEAEADPELEAATVGTVFPTAEQELAKACMAAFALDPQRLVICDSTFEASAPHIVERSAGLVSVLIAASRQAGGDAITSLELAAKMAKRTVNLLANILRLFVVDVVECPRIEYGERGFYWRKDCFARRAMLK